jgi:TolB-like protein/class 3 adenylate cyclase
MEDARAPVAWRFDRFTLDLARDALLGPDGAEISLRPKSLALLKLMVSQAGRVVGREAIMASVWPDVVVSDESITQCVRDIRKALNDEAQTLMRTVPKRGYLLAAEAVPAEPAPQPPPARAERRLAAILAADVVGYSRLVEADEAGTLTAIRELRAQAIDPLLAEHKGRIVKLTGDGAICEFASAVDAAACAVAVQRAVAAGQGNTPAERRVVFRIGVNLGDVVVDGEDLLGDGVNVAARLKQLCEPGGVLVSGTAFDHLQGRLALPLEFIGEQQVKSIARPVRAYRVNLDGTAGRNPAWASTRRGQRALLTAAAALFAFVFLGGVWWFWPVDPPTGKPAIAVLPFDNLGGDEATGRLADGITEDIITDLSRFGGTDVIARNSTEVYKGRPADVRDIGDHLRVGYVLEGSIQQQADRVRITAQLIDTESGAHLWSDRWDRAVRDVFEVQSELGQAVANKIGNYYTGLLGELDKSKAKRKRPQDLTAYDLYQLGREAKNRETKEGAEEAIRLLKQSLTVDPTFARAWIALFWAYQALAAYVDATPELWRLRDEAGQKAVELDPADAEAYMLLGITHLDQGNLDQAEAEFKRALSANPGSADLLAIYARWASPLGDPAAGVEAAERSLRLNPNTLVAAFGNFASAYFMMGRYEDALRMLGRIPKPSFKNEDYVTYAASLGGLGRFDEAQAAVRETLAHYPRVTVEWGAWWMGYNDADWQRLVDTMSKAGFPCCSSKEDLAVMGEVRRLPECETGPTTSATSAAG